MIGRLLNWWSARRLRGRVVRQLARVRAGERVPDAPTAKQWEAYPFATARVGVAAAADAVRRSDPVALGRAAAALAARADGWEAEAAAVVALACEAAAKPGASDKDVTAAFAAFRGFRAGSAAPVPSAYPVIALIAEAGRDDDDAVAAYLEYLACGKGRGDGVAAVAATLRTACRPDHPAAERRNTLARDLCRYPWAGWHLMELHRTRGAAAEAGAELDRVTPDRTPPDEPVWAYRAGLVRRALSQWADALACFKVAVGDKALTQAEAYHAEAEYRVLEARLAFDPGPVEQIRGELELARAELVRLCATPGGPVAAAVLVDVEARLLPPRAVWGRVATWNKAYPADLSAAVAARLEDADAGDADPKPARRVRRLLLRGRADDARAALKAAGIDPDAPSAPLGPLALGWADLRIRTGEARQVEALTLDRPDELAVAVGIEWHLATGRAADAATRVRGAAGLRLAWLERELLDAEAAVAAGNWADGFDRFARVLAEHPDSPRALVAAGFAALCVGQDDYAAGCFGRAAGLQPDNVYAALGVRLAGGDCPDPADADQRDVGWAWSDRFARAGRDDLAARLAAEEAV